MTLTAERPRLEVLPMTTPTAIPDPYKLLAGFSGIPIQSAAIKLAGLWQQDEHAQLTDAHRALLRRLMNEGLIRWVQWSADSTGYVLTGVGEALLDTYHTCSGPAHAARLTQENRRHGTAHERPAVHTAPRVSHASGREAAPSGKNPLPVATGSVNKRSFVA